MEEIILGVSQFFDNFGVRNADIAKSPKNLAFPFLKKIECFGWNYHIVYLGKENA